MPKFSTADVMTVTGELTGYDIENGDCGMPSRCMYKLSTDRALHELDTGRHDVRVETRGIQFNFPNKDGLKCRWLAPVPQSMINNLLKFDKEEKARTRALNAGKVFKSRVKPHKFIFVAICEGPVEAITPDRQQQINAARK